MYNAPDSDSFHGQAHFIIKWHFQHFSTGWSYGLLKELLLNVKITFYVLITKKYYYYI